MQYDINELRETLQNKISAYVNAHDLPFTVQRTQDYQISVYNQREGSFNIQVYVETCKGYPSISYQLHAGEEFNPAITLPAITMLTQIFDAVVNIVSEVKRSSK